MKKMVVAVLVTGLISLILSTNSHSESITEIINSSPDITSHQDKASGSVVDSQGVTYYAIQIGVFLDEKDAENKIIEFNESGYEPYIFQSLNSKNQNLYAVRIGKFDDYKTATDKLIEIESNFKISALVTYFDSLSPVSTADTSSYRQLAAAEESVKPMTKPEVSPPPLSSYETDQPESYEPATMATLQKKIQMLENEMNLLRDESDVRKNLKITEEEGKKEGEDILEAAGREYTLTQSGTLKFTYGFTYGYSEYDAIKESVRVEDVANHTISNSFGVSYGLKDNISVGVHIPFVYKYDRVGTIESKDITDLGNLGLSWQFQPIKSGGDLPTIIINGNFSVPVGRSPYEIQYGEELSTSSGIFSAGLGLSVSQVSDPVVVFSSLSLSYPLTMTNINQKRPEGVLDEVDQGMGIGLGVGMGYALSYKLNLNVSFGYSYSFETKYKYKDNISASTGTGASANLNLGVGYKISRKQNLNFRIGLPVTQSRQFTFSLSTPVNFEL